MVILLLVTSPVRAQNISFDILDGRDEAEVPFEFVHNFIIVDVRLQGLMPLKFIFDTGSQNTILFNKQLADVMGVEYDLRIPVRGADLKEGLFALVARRMDLELHGLAPVSRDILVLEEDIVNFSELTGVQVHGILGSSFFKSTVVEIDYRKERLIFHSPGTFDHPGHSYEVMDIDVRASKPFLRSTVTLHDSSAVELSLLIDSGAGLPLMLHNNAHPSLALPDDYIVGHLGRGLGGDVVGYIGRISELDIGPFTFRDIITSFQELEEAFDIDETYERHGLLGNQLLNRFAVIIDFVNEILYMKKRPGYNKKFKMDRSGLTVFATGPELKDYIVQDVIVDSPADEAGIQPGDELKRIQGFGARNYSLDQLMRLLRKREGKKIRLVVERDSTEHKFQFRLRDLI